MTDEREKQNMILYVPDETELHPQQLQQLQKHLIQGYKEVPAFVHRTQSECKFLLGSLHRHEFELIPERKG